LYLSTDNHITIGRTATTASLKIRGTQKPDIFTTANRFVKTGLLPVIEVACWSYLSAEQHPPFFRALCLHTYSRD